MRFSGRLDASAMISMHYPPETDNESLLATTDTKNPCLYLILSKLGLASDQPTDHIVWTERCYMQTSTRLREQNRARPYEVIYDQEDLDRCGELNRHIDRLAKYGARLMVNKEVVLESIARLKASPDWKLFTLPIEGGEFVPIYEQPFHGAVNVKTAQFHFMSYHTEYMLRDNISDKGVLLSDTIVNVFAVLAGITTVRPQGFADYKKSKITDPSLWKEPSNNDGTGNVLDCARQMRWVEKHRDHRFRVSQLSQATIFYVDKEGIVLDDHGERTPVSQILAHIARKSGLVAANKVMPDGRKYLSVIAEKGRETQRAAGFTALANNREKLRNAGYPSLVKGRETQRAAGFPALAKLHESQRAAGWPVLRRGTEIRRAAGFKELRDYDKKRQKDYYDKLQLDIEATNKRKAAEDPSFVPPPAKKFEQRTVVKKRGTIPCTMPGCKSKLMNAETMKSHLSLTHGLWSAEAPHQCPQEGCNRYYPTEQAAKEHEYNAHTRGKVACPTCNRKFSVRHLPEHRRDMHDWQY